jgi:hypothetical protein
MKAAGRATILGDFLRVGIMGRSRFVILASQRDGLYPGFALAEKSGPAKNHPPDGGLD